MVELEPVAARVGQHLAHQAGVGGIVLDQQDFETCSVHRRLLYAPAVGWGGSFTIVSQKSSIDFTIRIN